MKRAPKRIRLLALTTLVPGLLASGYAWAGSQTYTTDGDFDQGTLVGVNHNEPHNNQLQLNSTGSSFPVLWIANAAEDTLSKVDSTQIGLNKPGREVARYRTWFPTGYHGAWGGPAPSRTAVDKDGNAYVLDRWFGGYPTLFKILNNSFIDRNGDGIMQTSSDTDNDGKIGAAEMMPLEDSNKNGLIEDSEIKDERIAWAKRIPDGVYTGGGSTPLPQRYDGIGRALCIGTDGNLWVGLYNRHEYFKVSAADGHTIAGPVATGTPNYGCLIDQNGTLWGANWGSYVLTRINNTASDTGPYAASSIGVPDQVYGLALRRDANNNTHVIMGGSCDSYVDYDAATNAWSKPASSKYCSYAVGTDNSGNILVSKRNGGVVKFAPSGAVIWDKESQVGSRDSRGVIADANDDIWQVHRESNNMAKYNGSTGDFLGLLPIGAEPYTYSDASGTAALSITTKTGNWSVVKDSGNADTRWGVISWNAEVPTGAKITVEARASNTTPVSGTFTAINNGATFAKSGRYIETKVTLDANPQNQSPVLSDLTVKNSVCDINGDGSINKIDISLITAARNTAATTFDSRDADDDHVITVNDARICSTKCTKLNCAL